jgi:phosphatidylglycerol:prolipoprotein diacylglycerol transferase
VQDNATGTLTVRHPSQLYEAGLEGLLLFAVLWWYTATPRPRLAPTGLFFILYGCGRFVVEWVRLPDANIGYLVGDWLTMGMLLTAPMILIGIVIMSFAYWRHQDTGNFAPAKV